MNTRIRELRKTLKLTQEQFGNKIGLKSTSICDIEHNRCIVTERVIISICAKFNANETWLREGSGEMFVLEDKTYKEFFEIYKSLSTPLKEFLIQTAQNLLDTQAKL